jgi:hypothetical protein
VLCAGVSVPPLRGRPASARCTVRRARSEAPLRVARGDGASALAQPCRASPAYALAAMLASVAYPLTARPARRRLFGAPCADRAVQGAHHAEPRQERLAAAEVRAPCRRAVRADHAHTARLRSTDAKIEAMEAKLAAMRARSSSTGAVAPAASSAAPSTIVSASAAAQAQLPRRPPPGASKRP